jgi:hypothetical protein
MIPSQVLRPLLAGMAAFVLASPVPGQHLNVGALGTSQDTSLIFANGDAFVRESGYVGRMIYTNGGTYRGYYGIGLSPTALPATVANGGPVSNAPALGSFVRLRIESVTGPANGSFAFWDTGATAPSVVSTVGDAEPSALFALSDARGGAGLPGGDPFGHIHGRRFTVNKAGTYTVGFRAFDSSTNGTGYGPIHRPTDVLQIQFTTAVSLAMKGLIRTNGNSLLTFHQGGLTNVFVEAASELNSSHWTVIAGPYTNAPFGSNSTTTLLETDVPADRRIYRLRGVAP